MSCLRIAILAHSTNPRGGIVPDAMIEAIRRETRQRPAQRAAGLLAALTWADSATLHLPRCRQLAELLHA
jgi:hypothetical protein